MLLCERMGWTYDEEQDAPDWFTARAGLWFDVLGRWRKAQANKK